MKKFTKLFLSCAVATALSATMGVAAMADGEPVAGTVVNITGDVTGKVTITEAGAATVSDLAIAGNPTLASDSQVTFLVFKGTTAPDVAGKNVVGIDQGADIQPENAGLKTTKTGADDAAVEVPSEGQDTYTVKVGYTPEGGTFTTKTGTFKLGEAPVVAGTPIYIGDVDLTGDFDANDASKLAMFMAGRTGEGRIGKAGTQYAKADGTGSIYIGDVDLTGDFDANDASKLAMFMAGRTGEGRIGKAGTQVEVIIPTE